MNTEGSISDFFYNIIPGGIFLFFLNYCYGFDLINSLRIENQDSAVKVFAYIAFALFLGFFFQGITKKVRSHFWNLRAFRKVECNNQIIFDNVYSRFKNELRKDKNRYGVFYLMDDNLRGKEKSFMPTHFSSRYAFWSNMTWGTFILLTLNVYFPLIRDLKIELILFLFFSILMADEHLTNFYDSILKVFYMSYKNIKKF